ncbi:hypothetical protein CC77DRAFT_172243 [Alternaria alternata]|uniref:Uncharacterized protein n=1 Tax=Alternaria alternata TaxID=5599 RepID=A0A177DGA6_ALTAL|nr:hypothetical protein CC77DRAFT_172243 [Alternaria alternata]OAG18803.1 hypothetical protein CC77DRAFT_172243 [Alternaria alternata]
MSCFSLWPYLTMGLMPGIWIGSNAIVWLGLFPECQIASGHGNSPDRRRMVSKPRETGKWIRLIYRALRLGSLLQDDHWRSGPWCLSRNAS